MTDMLATDAEEAAAGRSSLETWGRNEPMRHVPSAEWMAWKVDHDLRRHFDDQAAPRAGLPLPEWILLSAAVEIGTPLSTCPGFERHRVALRWVEGSNDRRRRWRWRSKGSAQAHQQVMGGGV